jgi:type IV pilus assembly protein PilN
MQQKINFLPYRDLGRQDIKLKFKKTMIAMLVGGAALIFAGGYLLDYFVERQQGRNSFLQQEIAKVDEQLIEVKNLKEEIKALEIQRDTVYSLQTNRTHGVELAEMLVHRIPEEVYFTDVDQINDQVDIKGVATSNERVSQLLYSLEQVQWIRKVTLLETKSIKIEEKNSTATSNATNESSLNSTTSRNLYEFHLSFERITDPNPINEKNIAAGTTNNNGISSPMPLNSVNANVNTKQ